MKRTTVLATALLAAGLTGFGCVHEEESSLSQTGSARGETMQATGTPGVGADNSTGTTPTGTITGTTVAGSPTTPTTPQITTAPPTASSDAARAEIHAKDTAAVAAGPGSVDQTAIVADAQLAADKEKKDTEDKVAHHRADAVAHVKPSAAAPKEMQVSGKVKFMKAEHGVKVMVDLKGLTPNSKHGFHIHEKGDLSDPKLVSAGPHFNPGGKKHGGPEGDDRHGGDLGNLTADEKGNAKVEIMAHGVTIDGEKDGIIGRSILVHAKADDMKTDPSGDSGDRIAGGAIEKPKGDKKDKEAEKEKEKSADAGAASGAEPQVTAKSEAEVTDKPAGAAEELNK
jgi:Cu-Zn family superoxide dismutase